MQTISQENPEPTTEISTPTVAIKRLPNAWRRSKLWLSVRLAPPDQPGSWRRLAVSCAIIFLLALGVRLLHWQDARAASVQAGPGMSVIARRYETEAQRMLKEGGILFPRTPVDPGDARLILHPPGYSAFVAAIYNVFGESEAPVRAAQIILDALSAIIVFLIALEVFNKHIAVIAGILVALSPHFAHYSLWFSPDTLPILPILVAVYLIIKASKRPRVVTILGAGAMLGLSCWLRANGLLLAPFLAMAIWILFERRKRAGYAIALVGATILVISPITIRNWILYHRFIPISVDSGLALVEGIAEYDAEGRFGLPRFDGEALKKDIEWHNRPEYAGNLWSPDGIERDGYRFSRGLEVIRSNPSWFAGVMLRRGMFMLRYDSQRNDRWPWTTATASPVAAEPAFGHNLTPGGESEGSWFATAADLIAGGVVLTPQTQTVLLTDQSSLQVTGDASEFGDQFASAPILVDQKTDYVLTLSGNLISGSAAVKVTSADRRITLASAMITAARDKKAKHEKTGERDDTDNRRPEEIKLPFASGDRTNVLLVISNNGAAASNPIVEINKGRLNKLGQTPQLWTRFVRRLVRGIQRNVYVTSILLPLVMIGTALVLIAGRRRMVIILMAVPAYYLVVHSVIHTEYRYILPIHYFLFSFVAVSLYCAGRLIVERTLIARSAATAASPIDEVVEAAS